MSDNAKDQLMKAIHASDVDTARKVLDGDVDVNTYFPWSDPFLQAAAEGGNEKMCALLLDRGADVEARGAGGMCALHDAAERGHVEIVALLLEHGADIEARDDDLWTALHYSEGKATPYLLARGASVDLQSSTAFFWRSGCTPLYIAACDSRCDKIEHLLNWGANIEAVDDYSGHTPLHQAAVESKTGVLALLLRRGATINRSVAAGGTPLSGCLKEEGRALLLHEGVVRCLASIM